MKLGNNRISRFVIAQDNSSAWVSIVVKLKIVVLYYSTGTTIHRHCIMIIINSFIYNFKIFKTVNCLLIQKNMVVKGYPCC